MEQPQPTTEAAGGASDVERVVRLLIEADNSTRYSHVMVRKDGNDITTVGNLLVEIMGKLAPLVETEKYGMTLYDHYCAMEKELEKPLTVHPTKRPNAAMSGEPKASPLDGRVMQQTEE